MGALRGKDVFYSRYENDVFTSTAASPIAYRGMIIGSIYILEVDAAQGQLLSSLQQNLRTISLVIAAATLVMSTFFSKMLTARIAALCGHPHCGRRGVRPPASDRGAGRDGPDG